MKRGEELERALSSEGGSDSLADLGLRYDLTVPLTRFYATNRSKVPSVFKAIQTGPVFRAERPQKGRYREFYQCDADIVGTASMLADAEIIAMIFAIMTELGFTVFVTKLNNRKVLAALGEYSGVAPALQGGLYRAIDKLDKVGRDGVREEMLKNEIPAESADRILDLIALSAGDLNAWREKFRDLPRGREGIDELEQVLQLTRALGVNPERLQVDLTMVRGLDYYTGPIFETVVTEPKIGSLTGGGRYDGLIGLFSKHSLPVTGTTIGIERIIDVMEELDMFPAALGHTVTQVLVTVFDDSLRGESLQVTTELRNAGINTEVWYDRDGLGKQLKYAAAKGIPYAILLGPDEVSAGRVTLRNLITGEQETVSRAELADMLKAKLHFA
jgi:histidyl-tRNA synthetase